MEPALPGSFGGESDTTPATGGSGCGSVARWVLPLPWVSCDLGIRPFKRIDERVGCRQIDEVLARLVFAHPPARERRDVFGVHVGFRSRRTSPCWLRESPDCLANRAHGNLSGPDTKRILETEQVSQNQFRFISRCIAGFYTRRS
jgi:hypothetical protein